MRLVFDGCIPKLYFREESTAVRIMKELSFQALRDNDNSNKISKFTSIKKIDTHYLDEWKIPTPWWEQDYKWEWVDIGHELISKIASSLKTYIDYEKYQNLVEKDKEMLTQEIAERILNNIRLNIDVNVSMGLGNTYEVKSAYATPDIQIIFTGVEQAQIDNAFCDIPKLN